MLKSIFSGLFLLASLGIATHASAQTLKLGAHAGSLSVEEGGGTEIAYGVNLTANPYGWAGLRLDATFAQFGNGANYFSTSPALVLYPIDFEEMQLGFLGGAGFYKLPGAKTQFGMNFGVVGDLALGENLTVGMETRYHPIFDAPNVWTVFLTAALKFDLGGW